MFILFKYLFQKCARVAMPNNKLQPATSAQDIQYTTDTSNLQDPLSAISIHYLPTCHLLLCYIFFMMFM
jgi:hypothetical protein